jgi:hypothetical protein
MATKKKSTSGDAAARKALAGIEKAHKALQLNIKNLKSALSGGRHHALTGGIHKPGGGSTGGIHKPGGGRHDPTGGIHKPGAGGGRHTAS